MPLVQSLRVFHERRIALPVDDDALVLDVGSGDKPSWRGTLLALAQMLLFSGMASADRGATAAV